MKLIFFKEGIIISSLKEYTQSLCFNMIKSYVYGRTVNTNKVDNNIIPKKDLLLWRKAKLSPNKRQIYSKI